MLRISRKILAPLALVVLVITWLASGCSANSSNNNSEALGPGSSGGSGNPGAFGSSGGDDGSADDSSGSLGGGGGSGMISAGFHADSGGAPAPTCNGTTGWQCAVDKSCAKGSPTTVTGRVFDPAGANPLYGAVVFIPNVVSQLPAITPGTKSCNTCDASIGDYVAVAVTDADGKFTLTGVPTGNGVPITVQMGKWRKTTAVNITDSCATTAISDGTIRLPGNHMEGDMPQMALLTGGCDDLACFLINIGIDPAEFSAPQGGGRLDIYQGVAGATLSTGTAGNCGLGAAGCPLWSSKQSFEYYDIAILSCECGEQTNTNESTAGYQNLTDWLNEGGKVFASHYHYTWFKNNPDPKIQAVATWLGSSIATGMGDYDINNVSTFPKGVVFGEWLNNVGALASNGTPPTIACQSVASSVSTVNASTTEEWIYAPTGGGATSGAGSGEAGTGPQVKYLSFDTPIGGVPPAADAGEQSGPQYCGKAVFTDLHTSSTLLSTVMSVPSGCKQAKLTPQQAALEFLFFDLSACVTDDSKPPPPPPPPMMPQ
jgi:hypothetical protein